MNHKMYQQLQVRAAVMQTVRSFFLQNSVLEVDVPMLTDAAATDHNIQLIKTNELSSEGDTLYLQSSPEFKMKQLLSYVPIDMYSLSKVYRAGERGSRHNPEFTMLEWYRLGFDELQLIQEVSALINKVHQVLESLNFYKPTIDLDIKIISYQQIFQEITGLNPHNVSLEQLTSYIIETIDISRAMLSELTISDGLDLIFTHTIEPTLISSFNHVMQVSFIVDYPVCQSAFSKVESSVLYKEQSTTVSRRFECYIDGIEIANAYIELADSHEIKQRLVNPYLISAGEKRFIESIERGLPECAGIALGIDRLIMSLTRAPALFSF